MLWFSLLACWTVLTAAAIHKRDGSRHYYTLHFPYATENTHFDAREVAKQLGTRYEGPVGELSTYHLVSAPKLLAKRSDEHEDGVLAAFAHQKRRHQAALDKLQASPGIVKRHVSHDNSLSALSSPWHRVHRIDKQVLRKRSKRAAIPAQLYPRAPVMSGKMLFEDAQQSLHIQDPGFDKQWHLINQDHPGNDINVTGVWKQGINGNGTIVAILDDGLDYESPDLAANFYAEGSYDFNDHDDLPTPKLWNDYHGTRCAGQIAAVKNDVCGVGIAYQAKVSGVRILSGEITDVDEAAALNYKYQENDIFSCSWGPPDDGRTMEAPTGILADAFINGIEKGRGGKGSIYVFATGNGGEAGDNCNFDGYTNSIYTITVGALDHLDQHPPYAERCSAQLVVTYSSGGGKSIYTTNHGSEQCTDVHGGTSAAAPNAAGIFALVLSVRPDLSWRDMQHLCVNTAIPVDEEDQDWVKLPSGRMYNHKYGYGKLDASKLIEAAKTFQNVNPQTYLQLDVHMAKTAIPDTSVHLHKKPLQSAVHVSDDMVRAAGLKRLEHITATVNIEHQRRGDLQIMLRSPNNVVSELAAVRPGDASADGINNWKFMSVKHWDESPLGNWTLMVYDEHNHEATGYMLNWTLTLFGERDPEMKSEPVHLPDAVHETSSDETHAADPSTPVTPTPSKDGHGSRPTRVKPTKSGSAHGALETATEEQTDDMTQEPQTQDTNGHDDDKVAEQQDDAQASVAPGGDASTATTTASSASGIIYGVVGTASILALASVLYLKKRKSWRLPPSPQQQSSTLMTAADYEFEELKHEDDDDDEVDGDEDDEHPLLNSQQQEASSSS
ncbi:peptidase S8/S53 domain-containing protein [Gongronella butleri]|nr:peptidase S8/S53 domain-containing protein [Gongronella butleri]